MTLTTMSKNSKQSDKHQDPPSVQKIYEEQFNKTKIQMDDYMTQDFLKYSDPAKLPIQQSGKLLFEDIFVSDDSEDIFEPKFIDQEARLNL